MKHERNDLENKIITVLTECRVQQKFSDTREKVVELLTKHNFPPNYSYSLINGNTFLPSININELYLFTNSLFIATEDNRINPKKYFYDEEIRIANNYIKETAHITDKIIMHNVDKISDNQYSCSKMTYYEVYLCLSNGLITYNLNTQRNPKKIQFGDSIINVPNVENGTVIDITQKMLSNKFKPNTITLNIRKTGYEKFDYDEKNRKLIIQVDKEGSFVDIIDGAHRTISMCKVIEENPNHQGYTLVNIFNDTEIEAQNYIAQESYHTEIDKTFIAAYENNNKFTGIAKDINEYGTIETNELFNKLAMQFQEIKLESKYTTIDLFSRAIEFNYNHIILKPIDLRKVKEWLIEFFNELFGYFDTTNYSIILNPFMFIGYISISSTLYNNEDWLNRIEKFIENKDQLNSILNEIGISDKFRGRITQTTIKNISLKFKELINNG